MIKINNNFCPKCSNYKHIGCSHAEKEFSEFVYSIYPGTIIENDRKLLDGKELDLYLPYLNIAFEFDGTYWHADSRFYNADDILMHGIAFDIWKKDKAKDMLCESLGISLIRIPEYDWNYHKDIIYSMIVDLIK